jgi:hypothetical protein
MSVVTPMPPEENVASPPAPLSIRLRVLLLVVGASCAMAFFYANAHTEEFRLQYPRFRPWLWNLYLTCPVAGVVGALAMWWHRRWGFWTVMVAGVLATLIGLYAMGPTLVSAMAVLALIAVWMAVQPDWDSLL